MADNDLNPKLLQGFQSLNLWADKDRRAPHKPLLALWAIGRCIRGEERLTTYEVVDRELGYLLRQFGPHRDNIRTAYPFWRMRNDGIWEIDRPHLVGCTSSGDALVGDLKHHAIRGGFTAAVYRSLSDNIGQAISIAGVLVEEHFPPTLHDAVLNTVQVPTGIKSFGLFDSVVSPRPQRPRDPAFRGRILNAYRERCAVCAFGGRLNGSPLALEAAHIRWHHADGPSKVQNGIALCTLHHKLFDSGAFTLLPELKVVVARGVDGAGVQEALWRYDGKNLLSGPRNHQFRSAPDYLDWHIREVFKEPQLVS